MKDFWIILLSIREIFCEVHLGSAKPNYFESAGTLLLQVVRNENSNCGSNNTQSCWWFPFWFLFSLFFWRDVLGGLNEHAKLREDFVCLTTVTSILWHQLQITANRSALPLGIRGCSGDEAALKEHRRNPEETGSSQLQPFKKKDLNYSEISPAWPVLHSTLLRDNKVSQNKPTQRKRLNCTSSAIAQESTIISNLMTREIECSSASGSVDQVGDDLKHVCSYHVRTHLTFDTKRRFKYVTCQ